MSKSKSVLNLIGLTLFISAIVALNESIVITEPHLQLTLGKYYFAGGSFLLFIILIFMWIFTKDRRLINYRFFFLIALFYLTPIIAALVQPTNISFTAIDKDGIASVVGLTLGLYGRFQSIFVALTSILVTYLLFQVAPKIIKSKAILMGLLYFIIFILLGFVVYSAITEWDQYMILFTTGHIDYYTPTISLFSNTNVFGYYMSLGLFAVGVLDSLKHRIWHLFIMFIFFVTLLLTITITSYIGGFLFLALFIVYDFVTQYKEYPVRSSIGLVLFFTFVIFATIGLTYSRLPLARTVRDTFIPKSIESLQSRIVIWRHGLELIFGKHLWIGHGFAISNSLLQVAMGVEGGSAPTNRFHQGWIEVLATGGLIGMLFYLVGIGIVVYLVVKRHKNNPRLATTALFIMIGILVQSIAEAKFLFKADAMGTIGTLLIVVPLLVDEKLIDRRVVVTPLPRMFSLDQH